MRELIGSDQFTKTIRFKYLYLDEDGDLQRIVKAYPYKNKREKEQAIQQAMKKHQELSKRYTSALAANEVLDDGEKKIVGVSSRVDFKRQKTGAIDVFAHYLAVWMEGPESDRRQARRSYPYILGVKSSRDKARRDAIACRRKMERLHSVDQ